MKTGKQAEPTVIVIFGGTGDLTNRKLIPAFYNLFLDGWLPEHFLIIGLGRTNYTEEDYRNRLHEGLGEFSRTGKPADDKWEVFKESITYLRSEINNAESY